MKLRLRPSITPFDLEHTVQSGQVFRWQKYEDFWWGIVEGRVLRIRQSADVLEFDGADADCVRSYFRLDDNFGRILPEISIDSLMKRVVHQLGGLRIVRQNPWECLISYVCATHKSIPAIKMMIANLSRRFGQKLAFEDRSFFGFPEPRVLAGAPISDLKRCGLGFRAERIRAVARIVESGELDLEELKRTDYERARCVLLKLPGVGNKVADCVSLFSLEKLEAFPVDIWMKRAIRRHYASNFSDSFIDVITKKESLSSREYNAIGRFARSCFGKYAGYAQQYLFHFMRTDSAPRVGEEEVRSCSGLEHFRGSQIFS